MSDTSPKDRVRSVPSDPLLDDITDAEIVDEVDDADVARVVQDDRVDASSVDADDDRAAATLAEVLDEDLAIVVDHDDEGELTEILEASGRMLPTGAASAAVVSATAADVVPAAVLATDVARPEGHAAPMPHEEVEVECPGCGLAVVGTDPRPTASWFCPRCDYPLFLVRRPVAPEPSSATRGARRRLPGTAGRTLTAAGSCWNCGEWNEAGSTTCLRCAATLPRPEAPRVPAEVVPPELELVEVEVMYWPPTIISTLGGFGAGMVFLWAVLTALERL
jgi:hypothetical protein